MIDVLKRSGVPGWILRFFRVPVEPSPPAGDENSLRIFRAAPGWFRYRCVRWVFKQIGALIGLIMGFLFLRGVLHDAVPSELSLGYIGTSFLWVELFGLLSFLVQLPLSFLMLKLDYEYRWYMITDRSLRIREGLMKIREQTMSFANIQNISVEQGPIQRFFGIADLKVRTAGGGNEASSGKDSDDHDANLHIGYFRGVDDVEGIRNAILSRQRRLRHGGVSGPDEVDRTAGDPERMEPPAIASAPTTLTGAEPDSDALLAAAHDLLGEAVALRRAMR